MTNGCMRGVRAACGLAVLLAALGVASCARLWDSRQVVITVPAPLPAHCVETAMDAVFGAGATRPNPRATNFVVAAMPWEAYVRTYAAADDQVTIDIELTRWNRYSQPGETLAGMLAKSVDAVAAACGGDTQARNGRQP